MHSLRNHRRIAAPLLALLAWLAGCSDAPDETGAAADARVGGPQDTGLPPVQDVGGRRLDAAPDGGAPVDPCAPNPCAQGEVCTAEGAGFRCALADCDTLTCAPDERCEPQAGGGAVCVSARCDNDLACPEDAFCDLGGMCTPDRCEAGRRSCNGDAVEACADNGGALRVERACDSAAPGYDSLCVEAGALDAACTCRDAWDCGPWLACEGGRCRGTGDPPTCRLDPVPLDRALPAPEIVWGGTAQNVDAVGSPFPESAQAVMTPVVANLDDDNGDGLVDERDFPEILFMTFCGSNYTRNGALRAVEGGGPNKGQDAFATLGEKHWEAGQPLPAADSYGCGDGLLDPTASLAVADLDDPATSDGRPEIVGIHRNDDSGVVVHDSRGVMLFSAFVGEMPRAGGNPAVAIANVDGRGPAEIVVGPYVITVGRNAEGQLEARDLFAGRLGRGVNGQGAVGCVANLLGDERAEIVAGGTVYAFPEAPAGATRRADCVGNGGAIEPADDAQRAWCEGELLVAWDAVDANPGDDRARREGFCAVADVLGAAVNPDGSAAPPGPDNRPDGVPEVVLVSGGAVQVLDGLTGALRFHRVVSDAPNAKGGAPNVDDFDGDGFPEIGSAFRTAYEVVDLQTPSAACAPWPTPLTRDAQTPPENPARTPGGACAADADCAEGATCGGEGQCVCLFNGWSFTTEDDSSRVTGSTLFDFNGDGAAEVIYNDECWFRIFDGRSGAVLFREPSESRTRIEHPIVADVDNDGNAEIAFTVSNESGFCSQRDEPAPAPNEGTLADLYNNGLEVWGDPNDQWVSARRIWSQHAYHVTHVTEAGRVPLVEPPGWAPHAGRLYNTYRSQPRSFGVAPDLTVPAVQLSSPDAGCGTLTEQLDITARITNIGDLRVGPGVAIAFEGTWDNAPRPLTGADGAPLLVELVESLEPGASTRVSVRYDLRANGDDPDRLPDLVTVRADALGDPAFGRERECLEDNNATTVEVEPSALLPDLRLDAVSAAPRICPGAQLRATVTNTSEVPAADVVVRFYAGNPDAGAEVLGEATIALLAGGETTEVEVETDRLEVDRRVTVWAVVDPDDRIAECNDGDNARAADEAVSCLVP